MSCYNVSNFGSIKVHLSIYCAASSFPPKNLELITLSAKTNPRIPATSCRMKITVRKTQNCEEVEKIDIFITTISNSYLVLWQIFDSVRNLNDHHFRWLVSSQMAAALTENLLTVCSRQMFSRREPTQPQKVRKNMRTPTISNSIAGSTARHARAVSKWMVRGGDTSFQIQKEEICWEGRNRKHLKCEIWYFNNAFPVCLELWCQYWDKSSNSNHNYYIKSPLWHLSAPSTSSFLDRVFFYLRAWWCGRTLRSTPSPER